MKLVLGLMILAASAAIVSAQEKPQPDAKVYEASAKTFEASAKTFEATAKAFEATKKAFEVTAAKVMAEVMSEVAAKNMDLIKNSPFAADELNESVQTLADGNRIVRSSTGKIYRNGEGLVRREIGGGLGGIMGSLYSTGQGISLINPAIGQKYNLDTQLKTARVIEMNSGQSISITGTGKAGMLTRVEPVGKIGTGVTGTPVAELPARIAGGFTSTMTGTGQGGAFMYAPSVGSSRYETRSEDLGTRDFEGVSAEGTRKITTIPAGAIGNERPIEITYERWFSKELGFAVYSKNNDPRFGEQIYKLTNLVRTEPDPSLFSLPTGYKVLTEPSSAYRISGTRAASRAVIPVVYKAKTAETKPVSASAVEKVKP